jgi:ketosteroid isomerase-like protein
MSQENVELARGALEEFIAGKTEFDKEGMLTKLPGENHWDPEIEWDASEATMPDLLGVYRGKAAVRQWWRQWLAAWETLQVEYELVEAGYRVIGLFHQRMRGHYTGIDVASGKYAMVFTFRDGLIVQAKFYRRRSEAFEADGLRE